MALFKGVFVSFGIDFFRAFGWLFDSWSGLCFFVGADHSRFGYASDFGSGDGFDPVGSLGVLSKQFLSGLWVGDSLSRYAGFAADCGTQAIGQEPWLASAFDTLCRVRRMEAVRLLGDAVRPCGGNVDQEHRCALADSLRNAKKCR